MGHARLNGRRPRRVAVVTGTRAEYGLLRSVMQAIAAEPRLHLQTIAVGMHLLPEFGQTIRDIHKDGWHVDARVAMQRGTDDPLDQAHGLARGISGIARFLDQARTDIVLVLGDRIEAMAGALAAVTTGRVLAHIHGGDLAPGDFDDPLRHAITKLAHLHFPATAQAAQRILRLGEEPARVHVVGAPGLDQLRALLAETPRPPHPSGLALVVQHACGRRPAVEQRVMTTLLDAVAALGLRRLILYPNTDRGHTGVRRAIELHRRRDHDAMVHVRASLPRDEYLRALIRADVLVGNSSSGIIEAPLAGTPSVNVGSRQAGREPGGASIISASESPEGIGRALRAALRLRPRRGGRSVYGDGRAGLRIARTLARVRMTEKLIKKPMTY